MKIKEGMWLKDKRFEILLKVVSAKDDRFLAIAYSKNMMGQKIEVPIPFSFISDKCVKKIKPPTKKELDEYKPYRLFR